MVHLFMKVFLKTFHRNVFTLVPPVFICHRCFSLMISLNSMERNLPLHQPSFFISFTSLVCLVTTLCQHKSVKTFLRTFSTVHPLPLWSLSVFPWFMPVCFCATCHVSAHFFKVKLDWFCAAAAAAASVCVCVFCLRKLCGWSVKSKILPHPLVLALERPSDVSSVSQSTSAADWSHMWPF